MTWLLADPYTMLVLTVTGFSWLLVLAGAGLAWLWRRRDGRDMEALIDTTREPGWCACGGCTAALDRLISDLREWDQEMNTP